MGSMAYGKEHNSNPSLQTQPFNEIKGSSTHMEPTVPFKPYGIEHLKVFF